jgi:hypothetical protein
MRQLACWTVLAAIGILCGACGTTTTNTVTHTETAPSTTPAETTPVEETPAQSSPTEGKVGSTLSLTGNDGETMDVTVTGVLDPATGGEFDQPSAGTRFVGIKVRLKNTGGTPYSDSPSNGAALITNTDEEADSTITVGGSCNSPSDVKIAPGDTRDVCIPFEVKTAQKGTKFQFTLDSGFADQTGEWSLG